jgi:5-methylcytosine-specific restriction endonuclease McrA
MELHHRGQEIRDSLLARRQLRRGRRSRKTRYRPARFDNRLRPEGWLPPSIQHRVDSTNAWAKRLQRWAPLTSRTGENVRFDTQLLQNPAICGVEYQNGTLAGWEIREFLLLKNNYQCAYCGERVPFLQVEHMTSRARGGSDRLANLTMACDPCNTKKGTMSAEEFGFSHLRILASLPLKDAAAVNSTRWALWETLKTLNLPLESGTGGRTKKNRHDQDYPKAHWIDAACIGMSGAKVHLDPLLNALQVECQPRHSRRMCLPDKYGFPRSQTKGPSKIKGFSTGDLVEATVPSGKRKGKHRGKVAVRSSGYFRVGKSDGISFKHCTIIQNTDGYTYNPNPALSSQPTRGGVSSAPVS